MAASRNAFPDVTAVVLAGGKGRRMGGAEKGLVELAGRPLVAHVLDAISPQVTRILINANRQELYADLGLPVVPDTRPDQPGPLAGILAGLESVDTGLVLTVPCDTPCLPPDLVERLHAALSSNRADVAAAHDGTRLHQVVLLLRPHVTSSLRHFLDSGERRVERWLLSQNHAQADFSDRPHAFANANTPEELRQLEHRSGESRC